VWLRPQPQPQPDDATLPLSRVIDGNMAP